MIFVLTHQRPENYLLHTLQSIDQSATTRRIVVSDSLEWAPVINKPWELLQFQRPQTEKPDNRWAFWRCMDMAVSVGEDAIICEDDIELCRNGARAAELLTVPTDVAWISLFDPWFDTNVPHALWRAPAGVSSCAQMLKLPNRTCRFLRTMFLQSDARVGSDDALMLFGRLFGMLHAVHVPSLAQHIGTISSVGSTVERKSRSFRADLDAMILDPESYR